MTMTDQTDQTVRCPNCHVRTASLEEHYRSFRNDCEWPVDCTCDPRPEPMVNGECPVCHRVYISPERAAHLRATVGVPEHLRQGVQNPRPSDSPQRSYYG